MKRRRPSRLSAAGLVGALLLAAPSALAQAPRAAAPAEGGRIQQIRVEGSQRVDPETVVSYLSVKVGDPFDGAGADQSLKTLFNTGLFADVMLIRQGGALVVRVVENPVINRVAFEGNSKLDDKVLGDEAQLKARQVYTRAKVQADVARLLQVYRRAGKFGARIDPKIIELPQNRVDLVFEIQEGETTEIGRVAFIGNKEFSDSTLRGVVTTKESAWYRFLSGGDSYDPERLAFDREQLRRHYLRNGFADFRVLSSSADYVPDNNAFLISHTLEEGKPYRFGKLSISSQIRDLDGETLRAALTVKEGDGYDLDEVEASVQAITRLVGDRGYAFVEVDPRPTKDDQGRTIGIDFVVREGPKVFIERIDIVGNERTLDKVIRREFRLVEGDAFNAAKLRRSQQRIRNLNFFRSVEVANKPGSAADRAVVEVKVAEQSTGELQIGGGFSSFDGVLGQFTIRERNFLGKGQDLRLGITASGRRQEYDISFTEPYFLDRDVSAGVDIFRITRDQQRFSSYDSKAVGGAVRFGYQLTERLRQTLRYTYRIDEITNIEEGASRYIREQEGEATTSAISNTLVYDRVDNRIDPTDGYIITLAQDLAGLGGTVNYYRATARAAWFYPVAEGYVFSLRGEIGAIQSFGGKDVRINDRFFVGGDNLRGFRFGGAGPVDVSTGDALGGLRQYIATIEQSFPLGLPEELGVTARVFADFGFATGLDFSDPNVRDEAKVRVAVGPGVSWRSPFGPIRVDLGFPIVKESFDRTELFRFSFGTRF